MSSPPSSDDYVKLQIPQGNETAWARVLGADVYELDNIPFYARDLNWRDLVRGEQAPGGDIRVTELIESRGHRTIRVAFNPLTKSSARRDTLDRLGNSGVTYEGVGGGFFVLDCPPNVKFEQVQRALDETRGAGILEWASPGDEEFLGRCVHLVDTDGLTVHHPSPVYGSGDMVVMVDVSSNKLTSDLWERLWVTKRRAGYEILNIPFQAYGLALGDVVAASTPYEWSEAVLADVVEASGHYALRAILEPGAPRKDIESELQREHAILEGDPHGPLIAIDAPSVDTANSLLEILTRLEDQGYLVFDTGWR